MPEPHPFRRAAEAKDLELMRETLREDVVLHSPILFRGFEGRDTAIAVLSHVVELLEDFRYTDELARGGQRLPALQGHASAATASWRGSISSSSTRTAASAS